MLPPTLLHDTLQYRYSSLIASSSGITSPLDPYPTYGKPASMSPVDPSGTPNLPTQLITPEVHDVQPSPGQRCPTCVTMNTH